MMTIERAVWLLAHGILGVAETHTMLLVALGDCETQADVDAWHALALVLEPDPTD